MEVARQIKGRRTLGGALELEGVEVQVQLDKDKSTIQDLIPKQVCTRSKHSVILIAHIISALRIKQKHSFNHLSFLLLPLDISV